MQPPNPPTPAPAPSSSRQNRILIAVGIIVFLLVFGELWRRISQAADLRNLEHKIGAQVTELAAESNRMGTLIANAQSDQAVAEWARSHGKMVLPGEVLIQPIAPAAATPAPAAAVPAENAPPNWMVWMEWLWGAE
jgi:cell division protein FtsB